MVVQCCCACPDMSVLQEQHVSATVEFTLEIQVSRLMPGLRVGEVAQD